MISVMISSEPTQVNLSYSHLISADLIYSAQEDRRYRPIYRRCFLSSHSFLPMSSRLSCWKSLPYGHLINPFSLTFLIKNFINYLLPFMHLLCNTSLGEGSICVFSKMSFGFPSFKRLRLDTHVSPRCNSSQRSGFHFSNYHFQPFPALWASWKMCSLSACQLSWFLFSCASLQQHQSSDALISKWRSNKSKLGQLNTRVGLALAFLMIGKRSLINVL